MENVFNSILEGHSGTLSYLLFPWTKAIRKETFRSSRGNSAVTFSAVMRRDGTTPAYFSMSSRSEKYFIVWSMFTESIQGVEQIITVHNKRNVRRFISIHQCLHKVRTAVKWYTAAFCFSRSHFSRLLVPCQQHSLFYSLLLSASIRLVFLSCFGEDSINHTLAIDIGGLFSLEVIVLGIDRAHQQITLNFKNKLSFITSLRNRYYHLFFFKCEMWHFKVSYGILCLAFIFCS